MRKINIYMRNYFLIYIISLFLINPSFALVASISNIEYLVGEDILVKGIVDTTTNPTSVDANFYNSLGELVATYSTTSTGGSNNFFSIVVHPSSTNLTVPGEYTVSIGANNEVITLNFKIVEDKLYFRAHLVGESKIKIIVTNNTINLSNSTTKDGHNFSELVDLSLSNILHYGVAYNLTGGKNYTFVLVDDKFPGIYDTIYIDKSANFSKIWKSRKKGEKIDETVNYFIAEVEFATGNKIILAPPINDSTYSTNENIYFVGFIENSTGHLEPNQTINISLVDEKGNIINSEEVKSDKIYLNTSFKAPNTTGTYFIEINNTPVEIFSVETFKLYGEITNLVGTPTYLFAPNPKVKIIAKLKTVEGQPIDGALVNANVSYPDGTIIPLYLKGGNGTYESELNLEGKPEGKYKVNIVATYNNTKREILIGFEIKSINLKIMAINVQFLDSPAGPEAMVDSFAPNSKVSIAVMLINSTKGLIEGPPEEIGIIDIEDDNKNCSERVNVIGIFDENGNELNESSLNLTIVNLSVAPTLLNASDEGPPEIMNKQCMVIFDAPDKKGYYKIKISVDHPLGREESMVGFSVQKLYATANPVDFKGDDFWFYKPNETIKIKLKIIDLGTRQELDANKIIDAKILEMYKVWPSYNDVFTDEYKAIANETMINGTLRFITPDEEGFFMFKFKFKANLSGNIEEGIGKGFFMLKKYMIWGEPICQMMPCIFGLGKNISIKVNVVDIDKASLFDIGKSQLTCTDCEGLVVDVVGLWNDQLMKKMKEGIDYNITKGIVYNSSAILNIIPINLPSGWYHIDLELTDISTNDTYFGWAGFEIRNFWVDTRYVSAEGGNLTASFEMGNYGTNSNVLFGIVAYNPEVENGTPQPLLISNISLENINLFREGPPIILREGIDYNYQINLRNVTVDYGGFEKLEEIWVVNITGIQKTGRFMANVKVNTDKGSDIGTYWFGISTFLTDLNYRGKGKWPIIFASDEIVEINITAYAFNGSPVTLNENKTGLRSIWNEKIGEPIKPPENSTEVNCSENNCTIRINLSKIISVRGKYNMEIDIVDIDGNKNSENILFEVRRISIYPPYINDILINQQTDTPKRELEVKEREDKCYNNKMLQGSCESNNSISNCTVDMNEQVYNITTSSIFNATMAGIYCISGDGRWYEGYCGDEGTNISIAVNGTHLAYNKSCGHNCIVSGNLTIGDSFKAEGINWTILNITSYSFEVKNVNGICGSICNFSRCYTYTIIPPNNSENFSEYYFGYINNLIGNLELDYWFAYQFPAFNYSRPIYLYHNTTHLWVSNTSNLSSIQPVPVNGILEDPYGGKWKVTKIDDNSIVLYGQNVLAQTGAFVNTSLSRSGIFKIAAVNEEWIGYWDPATEKQKGIDLNGDNKTNSTVYFMVSDSKAKGVYDTLFYSNNNNFLTPISVGDNITQRTFGNKDKLVLLNIAPNAERVKVYSIKPGDWNDLGEIKQGDLVKIPVIVESPSGAFSIANVTLTHIRLENSNGVEEFYTPNYTLEINGSGELIINLSEVLNKSVETGRYVFGLAAITPDGKEIMEEWRWPFIEVRAFLVDTSVGEGGYINNFQELILMKYDEWHYGNIPYLYGNKTLWGRTYDGIFASPVSNGSESCPNFSAPISANQTADSWNLSMPFNYWIYLNAGNDSKVWIKKGDCNFSDISAKNEKDSIIIEDDNNHFYNFHILAVNNSVQEHGVVIGLMNFNSSIIKPLRYAESPKWKIMALNLSGINYNIVLANSSLNYPICSVWSVEECVKVAWFDTDGNFSNAINVSIGQNFTQDLYLASIGPNPWDGITIGNYSGSIRPGVGIWISEDTNTTYFAIVNESEIGLDLNRDGIKDRTYYILTFDDYLDNNSEMTQNIVDDDYYITENWWSDFNLDNQTYYDFYENETGMVEIRNSLPTAIWSSNIMFGNEENLNWDIVFYNNTSMLIRKNRDISKGFNTTENVTFILKVYNFDNSPIINANVSVEKIMRFTYVGGEYLEEGKDYITTTSNQTDNYGYALITISPNGTWPEGDYIVKIKIDYLGATEIEKEWFSVGGNIW